MPRKATGTLVWHKEQWYGRYWATVDGERVRKFEPLGTKNELIARQRLAALVEAANRGDEAATQRVETFEEAATRIVELRRRTVVNARAEGSYMRTHAFPVIGRIPVNEVTKADVQSVLEAVRDAGLSAQTIVHVRNAMSAVFKQLRRESVVDALPVPETDELPDPLPDAIDDRPKAILSDEELMLYLAYTDPREGERFRGPVRERQIMALFSRCVGGMRTGELHGLTWARAAVEGERFEQLEVVRYKTRRKAIRRGSKAAVRQLYPLGDSPLPLFLRYWYVRTKQLAGGRAPDADAPLFPVRRARRAAANEHGPAVVNVGRKRENAAHAAALRKDVAAAFKAAREAGDERAPAEGSRRWRELFDGTDDRRRLMFHNSRNMAAVVAERVARLTSAARFTGHASASMLQHYREMAGEVDVVPMLPELLPDPDELVAVLRKWCKAEGIDTRLVFGDDDEVESDDEPPNEKAERKGRERESPLVITPHPLLLASESSAISLFACDLGRLGSDCSIQLSYGSGEAEASAKTRDVQVHMVTCTGADPADKGRTKRQNGQITANHGDASVAPMPAGGATIRDMLLAIDEAVLAGDAHRARRLIAEVVRRADELDRAGKPKPSQRRR